MSGIAEVQSRIADIQSRLAAFAPAATTAPGTRAGGVMGAAAAAATGGTDEFSTLLASSAPPSSTSATASARTGTVARATRTLAEAVTLPGTSTATTTGEALLAQARKHLGTPYVWGGAQPGGFDCSGLVQYAAKQIGITLPRTAAQQATVGTAVPSLAQAKPGDLVVLEKGKHIGIYVGDGKMLDAPKTGDVVRIRTVWETPMTIRRLGTTAATTAAAGALAAAALVGGTPATAASTASSTSLVRPAALSSGRSAPYDGAFATAEAKYGLPSGLLSAVAKQESGYDPRAKSPAGALGLMQFMPATARGLGVDPLDPAQAIDGAGRLLASHLKTFGSLDLALAAYNAGPGNVRKYDGVPPFKETQNYVRKITASLGSVA